MTLIDGSNVTIGHLGIVAGMFDSLEIGQYIDEVIPKTRHHHVTHGTAVKALSLNGLGYNEGRLSLMPDFFEDIATERLLGKGIKPDHLNEYVFGETLDAIAAYGPTRLFTGIVLRMMERLPLGVQRLHHDTTSISVTGDYDHEFKTRIIEIVCGHSKDHRNDLKQFVISLVTNQDGIPVFMEPLSGNASDKKILLESIKAVRSNLVTKQMIYHMADSAFYTGGNIQSLGQHCFWISHVPLTITEAQELVASEVSWTTCEDIRYKYAVYERAYGGIPQRWVLFHSAEQQKRVDAKLRTRLEKQMKKDLIALKKLCSKGFACEPDARAVVERWHTRNPRYRIENLEIISGHRRKAGKRGRPLKDELCEVIYSVSCRIALDENWVIRERELAGRFILASNDTNIDPETMLEYYKEQNSVERGFRFLKDKRFHVSEVYLKNENRIAALSMLMVLCLLLYSVAEWLFRKILKERNTTVMNPKNKPTARPTMKRVFFLFRRVRQVLEQVDSTVHCRLLNVNDEILRICGLFGGNFEKYYS
jgi:transposase